jgi:nicotinamidase-related amidase
MTATALLLVDLVNPLDFACGEALLARARPVAHRVAALHRRARAAGVPAIFVNDNFDCWHLGFRELVERQRAPGVRGRPLIEALDPDPARDHFVLKPRHSGFYCTGLDVLLARLGVRALIVTGIAADICVLATAFDAHMRGYALQVPADCVAAETAAAERWALRHMERVLGADVRPSPAIALGDEAAA